MVRPRARIEKNVVMVRFLNADGSLSDIPREIDIIPVISIAFPQSKPLQESSHSDEALALIDTGADHFYIDKAFAERCEFLPVGTTTPSGANGKFENANWYHLEYDIPMQGETKELAANFVAMPLSETGRRYQALLGMTFLKKGRLVMDFQNDEYFFEFDERR